MFSLHRLDVYRMMFCLSFRTFGRSFASVFIAHMEVGICVKSAAKKIWRSFVYINKNTYDDVEYAFSKLAWLDLGVEALTPRSKHPFIFRVCKQTTARIGTCIRTSTHDT